MLFCAACGFGWQHPLPSPEAIRAYYEAFPPYNLHAAGEKESLFHRRLHRLDQLRPSRGRLLDLGAGLGHFLKLAQDAGWDVTGVEPQSSAANHCRQSLGVEVHEGVLSELELAPNSFDVVTLWDVWEHVHEPLAYLDGCLRLLRPGGLLALAVPNASGLSARLFRGHWRYVMFTHLSYFRFAYLRQLLDTRGLRILRADHMLKAQSLLQGTLSKIPLGLDVETIFRMGRTPQSDNADPDSPNSATASARGRALQRLRTIVLGANRLRLPLPVGDLVDVYASSP